MPSADHPRPGKVEFTCGESFPHLGEPFHQVPGDSQCDVGRSPGEVEGGSDLGGGVLVQIVDPLGREEASPAGESATSNMSAYIRAW